MSIYLLLVIFGGIGFGATALFGVLGSGHHSSGSHHHGGGHHGHAGHQHGGHHHHAHHDSHDIGITHQPWWAYFSPLEIFAYAIGAGLVGVALQHTLTFNRLIGLVIVGALVFNWLIVKPLMSLMMRFASNPSEGLEGMVSQTCVAVSKFDSKGRGLVKLVLDGQFVQLLAVAETDELGLTEPINVGDQLLIVQIDAAKNQCRVMKTADATEAAAAATA